MGKKMQTELETGVGKWFLGIRISYGPSKSTVVDNINLLQFARVEALI